MANKNGLTIQAGFEKALALYKELGDAEMIAFFEKRIEQNAKKTSTERKPSARQTENEEIKKGILNNMEVGTQYTLADMLVMFDCFPADMTPHRLAALLSQLGAKGSNEIVRTESKGKAYFSLA
jgi:hypothetical protein